LVGKQAGTAYGTSVNTLVYGLPPNLGTASPIGTLGDLYLNFGPIGTLVGGLLAGLLVRFLLDNRVGSDALAALIMMVLVGFITKPEAPLVLGIAGALKALLPLALIGFLMTRLIAWNRKRRFSSSGPTLSLDEVATRLGRARGAESLVPTTHSVAPWPRSGR
jgi:hypothetical protein